MKCPFFRWPACLITCLTALLSACLSGNPFTNKRIRATEFFKDRYLLMAQAIEQNNMAQLQQLGRGQDLSQKGDQDMDLMCFAIARKNFDAIRTLMELGVDPEKQPANGIGTALLQQGADFNAYTVIGVTPAWAVYQEVEEGQPLATLYTPNFWHYAI